VPNAEVHGRDTGHFALDTATDETRRGTVAEAAMTTPTTNR
jgi:hypothetical protein